MEGFVRSPLDNATNDLGNITGGKVSITSGFASGDTLACTGNGTITCSYNATTGILTFTGTDTPANWQTVFRSVTIATTSVSATARTVAFTIGSAIPYSGNGHFYEYISTTGTWTAGKAAAAARTLFGLQGYLATITSQGENDFVQQKLGADAWIGASDEVSQINAATGAATYANQAASEGHWYWVTGPEKGTNFANGNSPGTVIATYANWNAGEPNNWGGAEHSGEIYCSGGTPGKWNDLLDAGNSLGYVVEYGGMAGDPVVTPSASRTVNNTASYTVTPSAGAGGTISPSTPQTVNSGSTTTFTVTPNASYTASVGGTCGGALVGTTYTTNAITANCTVAVSFTLNTYTVTPSAGAGGTISPSTPQTINHGSTTTFTVTPNSGYTASVGGTCSGALVGTTYTTNAITAACTVAATFTQTCSYSISPTSQSFDLSGGAGTVTVTAPGGCAWTAASNASWADLTSGSSGSGNGTVSFTVAANSGAGRTGSLAIAGYTFTITQAGIEYTLVVTKSGTGTGSVYKLPSASSSFSMFKQLLCGTDCRVNTQQYDIGSKVFLYAVPENGTTFMGWSGGGCSGTGICTVTLNENLSVNAAFAPVSTPITDSATTTLTTTGNDIYVNVPVIKYVNNSAGTTTYYSTEFVYVPTNDNKVWLKLTKADVLTDISPYNGAQLSQLYQVGSDWRLHLTTIEYNSASVWADLEYTPTNDGYLWFAVTGSGEN